MRGRRQLGWDIEGDGLIDTRLHLAEHKAGIGDVGVSLATNDPLLFRGGEDLGSPVRPRLNGSDEIGLRTNLEARARVAIGEWLEYLHSV